MSSAHTLWLVMGQTGTRLPRDLPRHRRRAGEYSDASEWCVCWQPTEEAAEAYRAECQRRADTFREEHGRYAPWREVRKFADEGLDPWFQYDYNGTKYIVTPIHDDPRAAGEPKFTTEWYARRFR